MFRTLSSGGSEMKPKSKIKEKRKIDYKKEYIKLKEGYRNINLCVCSLCNLIILTKEDRVYVMKQIRKGRATIKIDAIILIILLALKLILASYRQRLSI